MTSIRGKTVELIDHNASFDFSRTIIGKNSDGSIFHTYTFSPIRTTEQELFQTLVAIREELLWKF